MAISYTSELKSFDDELAQMHLRGQWLPDVPRRTSALEPQDFGIRSGPTAAGLPFLWKWDAIFPMLLKACEALPESSTARRALAFKNPELPRCAVQTLSMTIQAIRPREIAWAHRHTIGAIRFVIQGNAGLITVVDGIAYRMEKNDLILTPSWTWHDHRNESDEIALWVDVLDVPFVGGLNVGFYEELGNVTQQIQAHADDGRRYAWHDTQTRLCSGKDAVVDEYDGLVFEYADRMTGGATLPTLSCRIQRLAPGFAGRRHRHTSSTGYHVVTGEGTTEAGETTMQWSTRDSFVVPNWTWHRHVNASQTNEALVFSVSDAPGLRALGFYREEAE